MGLMSTIAIGAAGYWLYRSGRLDPYIRQVKESALFSQLKDKAGMTTGSGAATPTQRMGTSAQGYEARTPSSDPSGSQSVV
jgi:hypothetical protein